MPFCGECGRILMDGFLTCDHCCLNIDRQQYRPLAFDLDGCIFYDVLKNWNDPDYVESHSIPDKSITERIEVLHDMGLDIYAVTGRTEAVRDATLAALERAGVPISSDRLFMQRAWDGRDALIEHKARALHYIQPVCYVGDRDDDRRAADMAGVPFYWTWAFRENAITPNGKVTA